MTRWSAPIVYRRNEAKRVHRHESGSGIWVIMGLDQFSKPGRKLNHSPYGKREYEGN